MVLIETVGAWVASVNVTGGLVPLLPAVSMSVAVMLLVPATSVTWVDHDPSAPTVAVQICCPLSKIFTVVLETKLSVDSDTLPEIVCIALLVVTPMVLIETVGAWVASVNVTGGLVPLLPAV